MSLAIRKAESKDLARIDELFENARQYMASYGNTTQWTDGFPSSSHVEPDIAKGTAYVCFDTETNVVLAVFTLNHFEEVYDQLDGTWSSNDDYVVIHRLACEQGHGVGQFVFKYVMDNYPYIRLDTHEMNKPMLHLMDKLGFKYCGTVFYSRKGGGLRVAYDYHR